MAAHPDNDEELFDLLLPALQDSKCLTITRARFLNSDRNSRTEGKRAFSVVVLVPSADAWKMSDTPSALLFGNNRIVERAYSFSPTNQCYNCWQYGHLKPRGSLPPRCPLGAGPHSKTNHRCSNPRCPKKSHLRPVMACCLATPACCPNCGGSHSARDRDCPDRPAPTPPPRIPMLTDHDAMEEDSTIPPPAPRPSTPVHTAIPFDLTTPRATGRAAPWSRSSSRTGQSHPEVATSPSPAPRDNSALRR